jgi:hypothetical protein
MLATIICALSLLSCRVSPQDTGTPQGERVVGSPTIVKSTSVASSASPSPSPVPSPTATPSIVTPLPSCDTELLVFNVEGVIERTEAMSGIYAACIDGFPAQRIIAKSEIVPDDWAIRSMAVSPDGGKLALSVNSKRGSTNANIFMVDLADLNVTKLFSANHVIDKMRYSANGEYIGYVKADGINDQIDILHIGTGIVSQVISREMITPEKEVVSIIGFDWSPSDKRLIYVAFIGGMPATIKKFMADVDCSPSTHLCTANSQTELVSANVQYRLSWASDSTLLVAYTDPEDVTNLAINIVSLEGDILQQINVNEIAPHIVGFISEAVLSPNNDRIAFIAESESHSLGSLFVLNVDSMTLIDLTASLDTFEETVITEVDWIP